MCASVEDANAEEEVHDQKQRETITTTTVGEILPVGQLALRRGLTLLLMVVILAAGIIVKEMLMTLFR